MTEYSRIARGSFTTASTPVTQVVYLPFQPTQVTLTGVTSYKTPAQYSTTRAYWDIAMGQGVACQEYIGAGSFPWNTSADYVATGGISTFSGGLSLQYGPTVLLGTTGGAGIAKTDSSTLTVTTAAAHGLVPGNWVVFQNLSQSSSTGMQQIAGIPFLVKVVGSSTTFTVSWLGNAGNLTAITTAATGPASFKQILNPELYLPGVAFPWKITQSAGVVTVYTSAPTNFQVGQQIAFNLPTVYGGGQLNELPNNVIPAQPNYFYVTATGVVEVNSTYVDYFTFNYSGSLTTFNIAAPGFLTFPGLGFAQVKAIGDVNTGGYAYAGGNLYPSPTVVTTSGTATIGYSSTINGPAIQGAYFNNTGQGFTVGLGSGAAATTNTASAPLLTASTLYVYEATYFDLG
jgi:hypothetical protein